jgi:phage tail sheath protein FI
VPISPTYPGVYIEELPSTVHTIVGVSTSITAFVGYTKRGPSDRPTTIFSYGDFERAFGDLDPDCPLTYAVNQFFANGGSEAVIVRVASGDLAATLSIANKTGGGGKVEVLTLTASSSGSWANPLAVTIDYGTLNPDSLFNLTVTEYAISNGALVAAATESFRNLTMNSYSPTYAVDVITAGSKLVTATRGGGIPAAPGAGYSLSGVLPTTQTTTAGQRLALIVNGAPAIELVLDAGTSLTNIRDRINTALTNASVTTVSASVTGQQLKLLSTTSDERSSVHVLPASANDVAPTLKLGVANGGTEVDGIAGYNPAPTGTVGGALTTSLVGTLPGAIDASAADRKINVAVTANGTTTGPFEVVLLPHTQAFATKEDLRAGLQNALQSAAAANPVVAAELLGTQVTIAADHLVVSAGGRADTTIAITDDGADHVATLIGFGTTAGIITNVSAYSPATTAATLAQLGSSPGTDGTAPTASDVIGQENLNTGIFALSHVDLFNLLVLPDTVSTDTPSVISAAMSYCEDRRAFLIVDTPTTIGSRQAAYDWISNPATPKSANAAAYFPRLDIPDPMQGYRARAMPSGGVIAGLYARIDASRGVWKAPAGTEATLRGPTGVDVPLNDLEQGTLNPLGLNVTRALPVYGNVVWGARTLYGADQMANQWKYIPVRRLALFIEESLFRGTKWAVFEPNDEPLWAQIRLSVGTFMHNLFRQHAFEGSSPRQAYLVKCDGETTTQADIDLGIVNIIVGFAPLKPAEFVVIQITQLAGQLEV